MVLMVVETMLPASAQQLIMPLGDSITVGYPTADGYRDQLYNDLGGSSVVQFVGTQATNIESGSVTSQLPVSEQHQEGHGAWTIGDIDANLTGYLPAWPDSSSGGYWLNGGNGTGRAPVTPSIVLLDIGTNDSYYNINNGDTPAQSAALMETAMQQLLGDLKLDLPTSQIFVANLIGRTDDSLKNQSNLDFNLLLPAVISSEGSNFHLVDMYDAVPTTDLYDGLHPDAAGYTAMGDLWAASLWDAGVVPEPGTMAMFVLGGLLLLARSGCFMKINFARI